MSNKTIISVAGLVGRPVFHKNDQEVGKLVDLVFKWGTSEAYPPLSGILVRIGRRTSWISASEVLELNRDFLRLRTARLDLRDFEKRNGEVRLAEEILDHQLVDVNGARVVRASDLYLAQAKDIIRLVGVDVSYRSLIRRLGPSRLRRRPAPGSIIDWASVQSFGGQANSRGGLRVSATRYELHSLRPSELADLLEDLGRTERQELLDVLDTNEIADAFEEMQPQELEGILRESNPNQAAEYLANMEPDEAADALRDVDSELRADLLLLMPNESSEQLEAVLSYEGNKAGGFMTTTLFLARSDETIASIQQRLSRDPGKYEELDAVVVVDNSGALVQDITIAKLFIAPKETIIHTLLSEEESLTVSPNASIDEVADLLIASRRSSLLVINDQNMPIGRILADDVVDALRPEKRGFRLPKILS